MINLNASISNFLSLVEALRREEKSRAA